MVLLKKIIGNNFVHKLQAICLLEVDFNWMNKMIFAKQMIGMALERKLIPGECFLKRGSNCISTAMTKIFICNESRIHHHDAILKVATLQIAMIESRTTLLVFPFKHGAFHNRGSTYYSKLWRQCDSFYGQDLESLSNLMVGHTNSN
jgi:hypothetical protein